MKANPHSINSSALAVFEKQLAAKLNLTRHRQSIRPMEAIDSRNQEPQILPKLKGSTTTKETLKSELNRIPKNVGLSVENLRALKNNKPNPLLRSIE
jgi:hypothetical protein